MTLSNKVETNLFTEFLGDYSKTNFWIHFTNDDLYYEFKELCREEKAEIDSNVTKEARKVSGDQRLVFKNHTPRSRLLFVLYIMKLWKPDTTETNEEVPTLVGVDSVL